MDNMLMGMSMAAAMVVSIAFLILGVALIFSLPMIWYHTGHISRKLNKIIQLLEEK